MAMHVMALDTSTGLPKGEAPPASTVAVLSLVCGLLLCLGPLTAVPAIIAGVMARKLANKDPANVGGGTIAVAGVLLGICNLGISAVVALLVLLRLLM
jgi:hypothetical protein